MPAPCKKSDGVQHVYALRVVAVSPGRACFGSKFDRKRRSQLGDDRPDLRVNAAV